MLDKAVRALAEDSSKTVWIGTTNGLMTTDLSFGHPLNQTHRSSSNGVNAIVVDHNNRVWIGTHHGLTRIGERNSPPTWFFNDPEDPGSLPHNHVSTLFVDSKNRLWIGTAGGGAGLYDELKGKFSRYEQVEGMASALTNNFVTSIVEGLDGTIWIGTLGGGVNRVDRENGSTTSITAENGLCDNRIASLLVDDGGILWVGTQNGLSRYDPSGPTFRHFFAPHGLANNQMSINSMFKDRTGRLFFGTLTGFNSFLPERVTIDSQPARITFTGMKVFQTPYFPGEDLSGINGIVLSHEQNYFTIGFALLDFTFPKQNRYEYYLEGFDDHWIQRGSRTRAEYTNVPPGNYVFRIRGADSHGVWNDQGSTLAITITPPWWRTMWAYMGYVIGASALLFYLRRYEKNRQNLKHRLELEHVQAEKLKEIDQLKSRFFANISHEFRTPLTLIEGPVKQLKSGEYKEDPSEQYEIILRNSQRLLRLVNQLLDIAKIESGGMKLRAQELDLRNIVKGVSAAFESSAKQKRIEFKIKGLDEPLIGWFDIEALEKIIVNLLSNAFKFTPPHGQVNVDSRQLPIDNRQFVEISVSDTGIGIPVTELERIFDRFYQVDASQTREHEGTGIGLALTKELVELHRGVISVKSDVGKGATFTVRLPMGKEHLGLDEIVEAHEKNEHTAELMLNVAGHHEEEAVDEEGGIAGESPLVLIIEDNADMRKYVHTSLNTRYRVFEAANGEEGIQKAIEIIPDLIISDVMMPRMDGFVLCSRLKTDERTSHVPIILLTAKADTTHKIEGLETGADDYITKPFDTHELSVRVKNLIEQRRKLRERFAKDGIFKVREGSISSADDRFLKRAREVVEAHMAEPIFSAEFFAKEMFLSRMQLHRKMKALTDHSPGEFVRILKLERASQLLRHNAATIAEIAFQVGYDDPSHFAAAFRKQFGLSPSDFQQNKGQGKQ